MFRGLVYGCLVLCGLGATGVTLLGLGARQDWRLALIAHPRPQIALGLAGVVLLLGLIGSKRTALLFCIPLLFNLGFFAPLWWGAASAQHSGKSFSITHLNLDYERVEALEPLAAIGSDVLFLQELTPIVSRELSDRIPQYEPVVLRSLWNTSGSGMLVRDDWDGEVISAEFITFPNDSQRPLLETVINLDGTEIAILNLHVIRPRNYWTNFVLEDAFEQVGKWSLQQQAAGRHAVVIGDFNSTPWAHPFRDMLRDGNMVNGQRGLGLRNTWPATLPDLLRIPIDHVVYSGDVWTIRHEIGVPMGSDHLPLTVELGVP